MTQSNLFCISDAELAEERDLLSAEELAVLAALEAAPFVLAAPEPLPAVCPAIPKTDARRSPYVGPWPRKKHYHRCPKCKEHGSNGVNCYKSRCSAPVLLSSSCSWCR